MTLTLFLLTRRLLYWCLKTPLYIRMMCLNVWDRMTQWYRSSHYHHFSVCWKIDLFGSLFTYSNYQTQSSPFWWLQPLMTEVDRISLAPSVSSSALIRDGLLMKSTRRSVDQDGEMSWPESKKRKLYSAAAVPAESKQLSTFDIQPNYQLFSFN